MTGQWGVPLPDLAGGGGVTLSQITPPPHATWDWGTLQKGTWDQSLGYPLEKTWNQWKYYGMEMWYPPERTWDQWKYCGMEMGTPSPVLTDRHM